VRLLLIEDDADISSSVATLLVRQRYAVDVEADGERGLQRLLTGVFDLAIVDVGVPSRDGFSICRIAREHRIVTPLLILTALDAVEERIRGLDAGADDYLTKPFSLGELVARIRALLRRAERVLKERHYVVGSLEVDPHFRSAKVAGKSLELGVTEYRLLELFARERGMTLSRTQILEKIWDYDFDGSSNIVDVYVSQLRRKLNALGSTARIETVWGVGYKLGETTTAGDERSSG
jgi:DNA-binding response OmpR family regulator